MSTDTDTDATLVTKAGPAVGKLTGINHLQFIVDDIDESVRFYRDVLGFEVVRTRSEYPAPGRGYRILKNVFVDIGGGTLLSLIVIGDQAGVAQETEPSVSSDWLWPASDAKHVRPRKMDHLAFNVDSHDELVWFQQHLRDCGVETTEIIFREAEHWIESIYFYDPNGIPLEVATFDWDNPRWAAYERGMWLWDKDIPALHG